MGDSGKKTLVVLTGGPCGGKTTLMQELVRDAEFTGRLVLVPDSIPLVFESGLCVRERTFQKAAVQCQLALEDIFVEAAPAGSMVVCHRGVLDPLVYWKLRGWAPDEFFEYVGLSYAAAMQRYAAVLHLETVAIGAIQHYRRWPDARRSESPVEAEEIDRLCGEV